MKSYQTSKKKRHTLNAIKKLFLFENIKQSKTFLRPCMQIYNEKRQD